MLIGRRTNGRDPLALIIAADYRVNCPRGPFEHMREDRRHRRTEKTRLGQGKKVAGISDGKKREDAITIYVTGLEFLFLSLLFLYLVF